MRAESFAGSLDLIREDLPAALLPAQALSPIMALAARVPDLDGGFEVRLHDPAAPVDLSLCAMPPRLAAYAALAGRNPGFATDAALAATPAWQSAATTAGALLDAHAAAPADMPLLWLEWDAAALAEAAPAPCLLLQAAPRAGERLPAAAERAHATLLGTAPPPRLAEFLARMDRAMPQGVSIPTIGIMSGRPGLPLRLRLHGWPPEPLQAALHEASGAEAAEQLREAAALHARFEAVDGVTLDIPAEGPLRLGLPMRAPLGAGRNPAMLARFEALLDWLTGIGLCRPEAAAALRAWPGWRWDSRPGPGSIRPGLLMRIIVQFKLGFDAGGKLRAKAYFGLLRRAAPAPAQPSARQPAIA